MTQRMVHRTRLEPVNDPSEIPTFTNEEEEAEFWATHSFGPGMFENVDLTDGPPPPPTRPRSRALGVRFDDDTIRRLKLIARARGMGYQTLLKLFVMERLYEEEKRRGVIPDHAQAEAGTSHAAAGAETTRRP